MSPTDRKPRFRALVSQNRSLFRLLVVYLVLMILIALVACNAAYQQKQEELKSSISQTMYSLSYEYRGMIENFWQVYMPVFDEYSMVYDVLDHYYSTDSELTQTEKQQLRYALGQMAVCSNHIAWIAVISPLRDVNYIMITTGNSMLRELPADFPYLSLIPETFSGMENLGVQDLSSLGVPSATFALYGGIPRAMGRGTLMVGYQTSTLLSRLRIEEIPLSDSHFYLLDNGNVIFSSTGVTDSTTLFQPRDEKYGFVTSPDGKRLFAVAERCGSNTAYLVMTCPQWTLLIFLLRNPAAILLIVIIFSAVSIFFYLSMLRSVSEEVNVLREGLYRMGGNDLDVRIPTTFHQGGLSEIAESVNQMAGRLKENIRREKDYQLRQKEAELSDLQSKFNPHFLYNTLEMLRGRCIQNGDDEVAELITNLSSIFRSLLTKRSFISVREELAGSRRYLALFAARYGDQVEIRFDIASDVLQYGIIPNVFQPLIENYFQYGFDLHEEGNYICLRGESIDDHYFMLAVEDNGRGMTNEAISAMNATLQQPISRESESYGLKNLHQRLVLYYGSDCGVHVQRNGEHGLRVCITARKIIYEGS
ncbi:MAG: histidine kinase [Clostridia bacterium]|nr:histidine kinase [Clostridia bacterium]